MSERSEYIVYVDESGDHSLVDINDQYPVFVLAFCIFKIADYVSDVVPKIEQLKFDFFGHDMVVLHERELRKAQPPFDFLRDEATRNSFHERLGQIMATSKYAVVAVAIRKNEFKQRVGTNANPYSVALEFGLERVFMHLQGLGQSRRRTHLVFESRGHAEDRDLESEFQRILTTTKMRGMPDAFAFKCANKQANSTGLQFADMIARPIGLKVLRPNQPNRAWSTIETKMRKSPHGKIERFGFKVYP